MSTKSTVIAVIIAILAGSYFIYTDKCKENIKRHSQPLTQERVAKLVKVCTDKSSSGISYPGIIRSKRHAELFFRVPGPVIERNLRYGQPVKEGDILMRLDPRDYQREVDRIKQELKVITEQSELNNTEYLRSKALFEENAISKSTYDAAFTRKQVSDAQKKSLEESLKKGQDKLSDTVLKAPFSGVVTNLRIEQYETAAANYPVMSLDDLHQVEIKISIPAKNLPSLSMQNFRQYEGLTFDVSFPGREGQMLRAKTYEFKPVATEGSESFEVALLMDVPENVLVLPGMSVEVHNIPNFGEKLIEKMILPYSAVFQKDGKSTVWIYNKETSGIDAREIKIGKPEGTSSLVIEEGVKEGEYVVAAGGDWLTASNTIRVMNPEVFNENR